MTIIIQEVKTQEMKRDNSNVLCWCTDVWIYACTWMFNNNIHVHAYISTSVHQHTDTVYTGKDKSTLAHIVHPQWHKYVRTYTYTCNKHTHNTQNNVCLYVLRISRCQRTCTRVLYDRHSCKQCVGTLYVFQSCTTATCTGGFRGLNPRRAVQTQDHPCGCTSCDAHTA